MYYYSAYTVKESLKIELSKQVQSSLYVPRYSCIKGNTQTDKELKKLSHKLRSVS